MTSLGRNFSDNVFANSNCSSLLIAASEVHWRVQPTAARRSYRFSKVRGALCALHVSLRKWLKKNNRYLITLLVLISWRYRVWGASYEA